MHGYVSEWCADSWSPSHEGVPKDGSARSAGGAKERAIKGGSFADPADECRCASRRGVKATERSDKIGFRCVLVKVAGKKEKGAE
jgi:formylglycine-generating enzyme required for sulfatase activity